MHRKNDEFLWHKLTTRNQNWIIIEVCVFISLLTVGILSLISKI